MTEVEISYDSIKTNQIIFDKDLDVWDIIKKIQEQYGDGKNIHLKSEIFKQFECCDCPKKCLDGILNEIGRSPRILSVGWGNTGCGTFFYSRNI